MLRFAVGGQCWSARGANVLPKPLMKFFWGKWPPFEKIEIMFPKFSWWHLFTFCVQILRKSSAGKWMKRCVVSVTKKFAKPVSSAPGWRRTPTVCRGACHVSVKFGPNRFRFAGVIPETCDFVRSHYIYVFVI